MAGSQISTSVTIINSLLGYQAISFTNLDTTSVLTIAAGSKVEIASGFYTFASDDQPQASTWAAIGTATTAYITLTPSGSAGTQIVTSKWSDTAPTWNDSKQGWYLSAASSIRYVASVYKKNETVVGSQIILSRIQDEVVLLESGANEATTFTVLDSGTRRTAIYRFGEWNMDATPQYQLAVPMRASSIIGVAAYIISDIADIYYSFERSVSSGNIFIDPFTDDTTHINFSQETGGYFDNSLFEGTVSTVAHRGYAVVDYFDGTITLP